MRNFQNPFETRKRFCMTVPLTTQGEVAFLGILLSKKIC